MIDTVYACLHPHIVNRISLFQFSNGDGDTRLPLSRNSTALPFLVHKLTPPAGWTENRDGEDQQEVVGSDVCVMIPPPHFHALFHCGPVTLPHNVVLVGWSSAEGTWFCTPDQVPHNWAFPARLPATLAFLRSWVVPGLVRAGSLFWMMLCYYDGWRERQLFSSSYRWVESRALETLTEWQGEPGDLPIMGERRWLACYGAHRGDPSALLLPEAHYMDRNCYRTLFRQIDGLRIPWSTKRNRAIYCGTNHGERTNYFPPLAAERPHSRSYLQEIAAEAQVEVHLDQQIPIRHQIDCKYILDVDGYTRTWDAWAWKMRSGSVVLSVESPWESFFTRLFQPWEHFVPIANDFSDLREKIDWCLNHDAHCRRIALQAYLRAKNVYKPENVARRVARSLDRALQS